MGETNLGYQVPKTSRVKYVKDNIFEFREGTIIVNFTHEQENKFIGIPHGESRLNLCRGFGDYKIFKIGKSLLYSIFDRNFPSQNVSATKMKILLEQIKSYANDKGITNISINEINIIKYNLGKFINLLEKVFDDDKWNVKIHLNSEYNTKINYVVNSARQVSDLGKSKPIIELRISDMRTAGLIDTGADVSLIDFEFVKDRNIRMEENDGTDIIGVTGSNLKIMGICNLPIGARDAPPTKLYVVQGGNLSIPFLFGCDFLRNNDVVINFKNNTIAVNGQTMKWLESDNCILSDDGERDLVMDDYVKVPPRSGVTVKFKLDIPKDAKYFQVTNVDWLMSKMGYVFPQEKSRGIFPIINNTVDIQVHNKTNLNFLLTKGYTIGKITFIKEEPTVKRYATRISKINSIEVVNDDSEKKRLINQVLDSIEDGNSEGLREILMRNLDAFGKDETDIGKLHGFQHRIDLQDDIPVALRPYRAPHSKVKEIDAEIIRLKKAGVIEDSISAYSAPCLLVYKKSGKPRLVVDFRQLNKKILPIQYPLPHLETALQQLGGNNFFTTLDLLSGYHQIELRPEDQHKTAFTTGRGLYHYTRVPFGMMTSGAAMQYAMERVLGELNGRICQTYIDDIVVYGKDRDEHDKNLDRVLDRLKKSGFKLNFAKCHFRKRQVECLGHIISGEGIKPNPSKVQDIQNKKEPRNVKDIRSFLGMASYYRRFVDNFSKVAKPITDLTKKDVKWNWTKECSEAYKQIIKKITEAPVLVYPDFNDTFYVTTDASVEGLGAVLTQVREGKHRPISFYSRALNNAEKKYHIYELEALAIKASLQKFRFYVLGYKIIVRTDNQPALYLLRSKECQGRTAKYLAAIMEFNPKFEYIKGKENYTADFLSRNVFSIDVKKMDITAMNEESLKIEQKNDKDIQNSFNKSGKFRMVNGLVYKTFGSGLRLYIPKNFANLYIKHFHNVLGCHEGIKRTYNRLKKYVFWKGMKNDIVKWINNCHICKISKPSHQGKSALGEYPEVCRNFQRIHIDLLGPLPNTFRGNKFLLVGIDTFSHWTFLRPLRRKDSNSVAKVVDEELIKKGRIPEMIVVDQGREFNSQNFQELCKANNINVHYCAPYHHASNGLVERLNLQVENSLRCLLAETKGSWDKYIGRIELSLNTTVHGSVGRTPHELVCNKVFPVDLKGIINDPEFTIEERGNIEHDVQIIRKETTKLMLKTVNKSRKYKKVNLGDKVYVRVHDLQNKLKPIYKGPVTIIKVHNSKYSYDVIDQNGVVNQVHINNIK